VNLKNITPMQIVGIVLLANGVITGSVNEMTDLIGAIWAKHLVSLAIMGSGFCGGLVTMFGGQGYQVKSVLAMPGVEKIDVNGQASAALATIAMDPNQNKIAPTPAAMDKVTATAKAAS
jgi:hypothetical protein